MLGKQDWSYVSGARHLLHGAHGEDDDVTSVKLSADGSILLSRSEDATLKVLEIVELRLARRCCLTASDLLY